MTTLHIAPGDSAGGALRAAIREAGRNDEVLAFRDDLSCGPINSDHPASRAQWWSFFYDAAESEQTFREFWDRVATTSDRLVVWFGRHSASELAFFHAFVDRLGPRPYEIIDVAGFKFPMVRREGSPGLSVPTKAVGMISVANLQSFLGSERAMSEASSSQYVEHWRTLKAQNAHFRIVSANGLISAPLEHFDHLLIERATDQWTGVFHVIGKTIGYISEPYLQVGDLMLLARITALIEQEKLLADGDAADPRNCRIRLPD